PSPANTGIIHFGSRLRERLRSTSAMPAPARAAAIAANKCQIIYSFLKKIGLPNGSPTPASTSCQARPDVWLHYLSDPAQRQHLSEYERFQPDPEWPAEALQ